MCLDVKLNYDDNSIKRRFACNKKPLFWLHYDHREHVGDIVRKKSEYKQRRKKRRLNWRKKRMPNYKWIWAFIEYYN